MSRRARVLLVFPPQWSPQNPHFSLRALMGHLRSRGIDVGVRDLNVEFYDSVLSPDYLQVAAERVRLLHRYLAPQSVLRMLSGDPSVDSRMDALRFGAIDRYLKEKAPLLDHLPRVIQDAKETLRDPRRFYNPDWLIEAFQVIDQALELVSLPYYPAYFSFNYFEQPDCRLNVASLVRHASDAEHNLFHDFFARGLPELLEADADYVGISVNAFSQVLPGLTLARLLKREASCHVGIGGNFFARVQHVLVERPAFFREFADSVAVGEGEHQLVILAETLASGRSLHEVPNLLFEEGDRIVATPEGKPLPLNETGLQDLEGLPLERYFTPELVLTIQASKGCYWGQCTFCDTDFGVAVDTKHLDRLVAEIKVLRERFGVRHFQFVDEAIRPVYMRRMAERFLDERLDIRWFCNGRLERAFSPELMGLLAEAGLRMVLWGFESGSQRLLDLMKKGIDAEGRYEVLRASAAAGIWNFAYIFFGFPTETREEALSTIAAICDHTELIHSYGRSVFTLGKQSPLFQDAAELGVMDVVEDLEELSSNLHYRTRGGMSDEALQEVVKLCTRRCSEAYGYGLWFFLRYRENIHLYVSRFGLDLVRHYQMPRYAIPETCEEVF